MTSSMGLPWNVECHIACVSSAVCIGVTSRSKSCSIRRGDEGLDKDTSDTNGDKATVQSELDAVNQYFTGIKARCIAKAETYADRTARREAEIAGLKEALTILDGEAVLLQRKAKHVLRGAH